MKKISVSCRVLAIILLFVTFSCKKNSFKSADTPVSASKMVDSNAVSMSLASGIAFKNGIILTQMSKTSVNSSSTLQTKQILDSLAVPDNSNPSYYIFNYVGGGFAIISADKRVQPILAFNNKGYFDISTKKAASLEDWLSVTHKNMQILKKSPDLKAPKEVLRLWKHFITNPVKNTNQIVNSEHIPPCEDFYSDVTVGPLLSTHWGQWAPYNDLCPYINPSSAGLGRTPTGCVATAMAQVMNKWQHPSGYSWSTMYNYNLAQLMLDAGTTVAMYYTPTGSYPLWFYSPNISSALKNYFGYGNAADGDINYATIKANLDLGMPVILHGDSDTDGHCWVCEGYSELRFGYCATEDSPAYGADYLYFTMNWGWNGTGDGDFAFGDWTVFDGTKTQHFHKFLSMTYNIHP